MTKSLVKKFGFLFLFTFYFNSISYSQGLVPYTALESSSESIDWFFTGYSSGGEVFKLGKVMLDSGYGASAADRIRVSVMTKVDIPCTYGNCPSDNSYFSHHFA